MSALTAKTNGWLGSGAVSESCSDRPTTNALISLVHARALSRIGREGSQVLRQRPCDRGKTPRWSPASGQSQSSEPTVRGHAVSRTVRERVWCAASTYLLLVLVVGQRRLPDFHETPLPLLEKLAVRRLNLLLQPALLEVELRLLIVHVSCAQRTCEIPCLRYLCDRRSGFDRRGG